jgi:hypothetical protein
LASIRIRRADRLRGAEALRLIDGCTEGECDDCTDAGDSHQPVADRIATGDGAQSLVDDRQLLA